MNKALTDQYMAIIEAACGNLAGMIQYVETKARRGTKYFICLVIEADMWVMSPFLPVGTVASADWREANEK